jgi:gamma-glutamyltranspeptidase
MERFGFSADTLAKLRAMGHTVNEVDGQGVAQVIVLDQKQNVIEGGLDRRASDGGAAGR